MTTRVIAGESHGVLGAVQRKATQPLYLDLHFERQGNFSQPLPANHNAFIYVYRGEIEIAGNQVPEQRMAILKNDVDTDGVVLNALGPTRRVLLIAGQPLKEPIFQYGPFVMNTDKEISQAIEDFQAGRFNKAIKLTV